MTAYDIAIIGAGPGVLACALKAVELGLSYILLEKGQNAFQGIIDSYPRGKKVYPTNPKRDSGPFPVEELMPDENKKPVDQGGYGEAKTVARKLENPADHIGAPTLVIGDGNAAAPIL